MRAVKRFLCAGLALMLFAALPALAQESCILFAQPEKAVEGFEIRFLDIALGDSFFLRCGDETMLVDGGVKSDGRRLRAYFASQGITGVTYLVNTHSHDDHIDGLTYLLSKGFSAQVAISPYRMEKTEPHHAQFVKQVRKQKVTYRTVSDGDTMRLGDAEIRFFRCTEADAMENRNDNALVMTVRYGDRSVLLLSDIGGRVQPYFAEQYGALLKADIVKSMHHGINLFVRELLETVQPALVVCTSSRKRVPRFVEQMERYGLTALYASEGVITAVTDGRTWHVWQGGHMNQDE